MAPQTPDRGSSLYAAYRAELAANRVEQWTTEFYRLSDKADTVRGGWRTRYLHEAEHARQMAANADRDHALWQDRFDTAVQREEADVRRREKERQRREKRKRRRREAKRKRWEYVLKVQYKGRGRRGSRPKHHHVWWDVRLSKSDASRATDEEVRRAVNAIRRGEQPPGWTVLGIGWDRGTRQSWEDAPGREAEDAGEAASALAALAATLGRAEGEDFKMIVVGEEDMSDAGEGLDEGEA